MNDQQRAAMQMALDWVDWYTVPGGKSPGYSIYKVARNLREALAQPQEPVAYMDAVDNRLVYVAPKRKGWMSEREDKEWRKFHSDNQYNIPLIIKEQK